jgi:hypothetical protein
MPPSVLAQWDSDHRSLNFKFKTCAQMVQAGKYFFTDAAETLGQLPT